MTPTSGSAPPEPFSVAHLSDPHISLEDPESSAVTGLALAINRVLALRPHPTCVVITGDLTDTAHPVEYGALRAIIAGFPIPVHVATGNHDDHQNLISAFKGGVQLGGGDSCHYLVEYPGFTLVVLDSLVPGAAGGFLGTDQLNWLDAALEKRPDVPALVCVHHPPVPVGMPFADGMRLDDGPALEEVVARHPNVVRVLAGHVHRPTVTGFGGSILATAPSTHQQSRLKMEGEGPMGFTEEPTAFLLHQETEHGWVTHTVQVSHSEGVPDLSS
ncbi:MULTISPECIES: phosphodiesterase [unclassified Nocardiopsis]|uniref:phosphodiesterase n=1 Tax=unclassified Nocardiopsis TaxID=2649073 RepID=UPI0033EBB86E